MRAILLKTIQHTSDITTFVFKPNEPMNWLPGQSAKIALPGPYGPIEHRFTIASAPHEKVVAITTRNSNSTYKKILFGLQPASAVDIFAIEGTFTLQPSNNPQIFVAIGIGITPYIAMFRHQNQLGIPINGHLVYGVSAHTPPYKDELDTIAQAQKQLKITYVTSRRLLATDIPLTSINEHTIIYLCGAGIAVDSIANDITNMGVHPKQIMSDWFTGLTN